MIHRCLSRVAAVTAACLILFFCLPATYHAGAEGNIIRAAVGGATGGTCGADWTHPCDLLYALSTAAQPGDEIWVKAGTYFPTTNPTDRNASFALRHGVSLYGGFAGTETARDQRDWKANPTILSGDIDHNDLASPAETADQIVGGNSLHVVYAYDLLVDVYMDGFIITAGLGSSTEGGGVLLSVSGNNPPFPGMAHLSNVHIMGSRARDGGCVYFNHTGTLTDALVSGCAADQEGGGIGIHGEPTLTRVTISGNTAQNGGGMGMSESAPILIDLVFTGNTAAGYGGGLHANYADPLITGGTFEGNFSGSGGGAIHINSAVPQVSETAFENNTSNGPGGAIYSEYSTPTLHDSLIANNTAQRGGGIYSLESGVQMTNVTVTGNTASMEGGGLYLESTGWDESQAMWHMTVANNTSTNGGGLYVTGDKAPELRNSIVWGNLGPHSTPQIVGTVSVQYSVIEGGQSGGYQIVTGDPLLGPLSDVGGKVRVRPLLPGSSAIDFSGAGYCPDIDARGVARPQGTGCDAGAYESRPFQVSMLGGDGQSAPVYRFYPQPLELSVTSTYGDPVDGGRVFVLDSYNAGSRLSSYAPLISGGKVGVWARADSNQGISEVWFGPTPTAIPGDPGTFVFQLTKTAPVPGVIHAAEDGSAAYAPCGESWQNACSFRNGLAVAGPGDEVWVKSGTYRNETIKPTRLPSGVAIYGGFAGTETTRAARDWEANVTILSGDVDGDDLANPITDRSQIQGSNSINVIDCIRCEGTVLDGFTITAGASQGGIHVYDSDAVLRNLVIQGNVGEKGGGFKSDYSSSHLSNVIFRSNHSWGDGGGAYTTSETRFESVSFIGNTATKNGGGAWIGAAADLRAVTFIGNSAGFSGGGIASSGGISLDGGLFHSNQAAAGGGLWIGDAFSGSSILNVTFSGNSASSSGGAIELNTLGEDFQTWLIHGTIIENMAPAGGGIYSLSGHQQIKNSILWGNIGGQVHQDQGQVTVSDSIVQGGSSGGTNIITADPLFAPLGDYGGDTQTFALLPGSPAIDAGSGPICPNIDQRGVTRSQGTGCDIGAYESRGFTLARTGGDNQSAVISQTFAKPLVINVTGVGNEPVEGGWVTFTPPASGASASITGSPAQISGGKASVTVKANGTIGTYAVTAGGRGIQPVSFTLTNQPAGVTIQASVDKSPVVYGEPLTFRAQVQSNVGTPTGKVQFRLDGADIGDPVDLSGGAAVFSSSQLVPVGTHLLTAAYLGSANHQAAVTPQTVEVIVQKAATTLTLTSSANPTLLRQTVTLTAKVRVTAPGRGQPNGEVIFIVDGGSNLISPLKDGEAEITLTNLTAGSLAFTAAYAGDANFTASPTASLTQWVHYPVPELTGLIPGSTQNGSQGLTLTIIGTGFAPQTVARWNGLDVPTIFDNPTTLRVTIAAEQLKEPAVAQITATNPEPGGGESNALEFRVVEKEEVRLYLPVVVGR